MSDYKSMYYMLFNRVTDAVNILQAAQLEGENAYILSDDEPILIPLAPPPERPDDADNKNRK